MLKVHIVIIVANQGFESNAIEECNKYNVLLKGRRSCAIIYHVFLIMVKGCRLMGERIARFLPGHYDDNMVGFFSQGPGVAFVYWELSGSQWEFVAELEGVVLIRLYRVIERESPDFDYSLVVEVEPPPYTNNWYFDQLQPDSAYILDVGCRLPDGSFFPLVKSEKATTPAAPRFDSMPKMKNDDREPAEPLPDSRPAAGDGGAIERELALVDIIKSMPFYMGYDTQLAG